ncbi:hypothetical protein C8J57DRAFT_1261579 [Mycena rebaudengoi]|nr:hypothetical protein C8J57DRAFT_1261579 [Mycena rebaudengoi]
MELGGVILPQELERAVFETAALLYHTQIPTLMLAAADLVSLLIYDGAGSLHRMPPIADELLPERAALLRKHARHLLIHTPQDAHKILAVCTAVQYFTCYCRMDPSLFIPYLDRIRPLLLGLYTEDLFDSLPDFSHSLFFSTTHLELMDDNISRYNVECWRTLASLPCLTHLMFAHYSSVPTRSLHMLLEERKSLQVLILIVDDEYFFDDIDNPVSAYPRVTDDYLGDWIRGAWGQADVWVRANNFIRLKRLGKVPTSDASSGGIRHIRRLKLSQNPQSRILRASAHNIDGPTELNVRRQARSAEKVLGTRRVVLSKLLDDLMYRQNSKNDPVPAEWGEDAANLAEARQTAEKRVELERDRLNWRETHKYRTITL